MSKKMVGVVLLALLSFLVGCAASNYSRGRSELRKENFDTAIESFKLAVQENPGDPKVVRDLGIAYFQKPDLKMSIRVLTKAFELDSTDGLTLFYLGAAHEILGHYQEAIDKYRRYTQVSRLSHIRKSIEGRFLRLIHKQIEEEAKAALAREEAIDVAAIPDNTVAVLYFKNMGQRQKLDPIQKGLTEMLITDLSKARKLKVVERVRLQKLMEEMGLGMTGLVDVATAPRVGKLLGASELVNGTFIDLEEEKLRIDAGIAETKTGDFAQTEQVSGALKGFFRMEKTLVFKVIDQMGIPLTQKEKDEIQIIPTENMLAFLAYCKGLDYEDRGMFEEAKKEFQKALKLDPNFHLAKKKSDEVEAYIDGEIEITQLLLEIKPPIPPTEIPSPTISDRLQQTEQNISAGFVPGVDSREPVQEQSQQTFGNTASIEIEVPLPH